MGMLTKGAVPVGNGWKKMVRQNAEYWLYAQRNPKKSWRVYRDVGYWLSKTGRKKDASDDSRIGPFDSFEAAAACFETIKGDL